MRNLAYELSNGVIREFPISESEASVVVEELKEAGDVIRIWTLNEQGDKVWEWKQWETEKEEEPLQRNWRHVCSLGSAGYLVWEVIEIMGEPGMILSSYMECPDGALLYVTCFHFFTRKQMEGYINDSWDSTMLVIDI